MDAMVSLIKSPLY